MQMLMKFMERLFSGSFLNSYISLHNLYSQFSIILGKSEIIIKLRLNKCGQWQNLIVRNFKFIAEHKENFEPTWVIFSTSLFLVLIKGLVLTKNLTFPCLDCFYNNPSVSHRQASCFSIIILILNFQNIQTFVFSYIISDRDFKFNMISVFLFT